jgi:hypothetical protein
MHTAQVYNLVLSDTIEGRIFLLLDDKLQEIARTLGKVDAEGNVAEDLRSQILGQLSERLNYNRLYQEALGDPELRRTAVELEAAMSNAQEAREVVFDLFQDLDGFSLDDYKPFSDITSGLGRLVDFLSTALAERNFNVVMVDEQTFDLVGADEAHQKSFTLDRDTATTSDDIDLLGLDHPVVQEELGRWRSVPPEELGVSLDGAEFGQGVLSIWMVETSNSAGERKTMIQPIAVNLDGQRMPAAERQVEAVFRAKTLPPIMKTKQRLEIFHRHVEPTLQRELKHKGEANGDGSYSAELIGYIELAGQ